MKLRIECDWCGKTFERKRADIRERKELVWLVY